jgi:hypothetical protein
MVGVFLLFSDIMKEANSLQPFVNALIPYMRALPS